MHVNQFGIVVLITAVLWPSIVPAVGVAEVGKAKSVTCVACHGDNGQSQIPPVPGLVVPNIGGQYADYLVKALKDYRSGSRENPSMSGMVAALSDQDIEDLAAYYAGLDGLSVVKRP